jgi:hypothetical protein
MRSDIDQPTTRREYRSIMTTRYSQLSSVHKYVNYVAFFFPDCFVMVHLCCVVYSLNRVSITGGQDQLISETTHRTKKYENNRVEQSHEATRVRERGIRKFNSVRQAQRFLGRHVAISNLFNLGRRRSVPIIIVIS